jgi:hypothetical protein
MYYLKVAAMTLVIGCGYLLQSWLPVNARGPTFRILTYLRDIGILDTDVLPEKKKIYIIFSGLDRVPWEMQHNHNRL